ncbi:MAG TPA: hypothetical protein VMW08_18650 [Acidimicrobiales bacterium]|nr:hypothetical protein [Acidimicrobiales bacterium]
MTITNTRTPKRWKLLAVAGLGVSLLLAGCGGSDDDAGESDDAESLGFVGTVEGTDAFVSVLVADNDTDTDPDEAIVYICDGDAELREWFQGPIDDPSTFELANDAGAAVTLELVDGVFEGEFTDTAGSTHGFDTVEATGDAGLYEVDDEQATEEEVWAAWVVDNDGNEQGAFLRSGVFQPTIRLSASPFRLSRFSVTNGVIEMNGIIAPNN